MLAVRAVLSEDFLAEKRTAGGKKEGGSAVCCSSHSNASQTTADTLSLSNPHRAKFSVEMLKMTPVSFFDALPSCLRQENVQTAETAKQGYLQLLPKIHDTDGFFISVLKKQDGV